ncbi:cytosolic protein [Sphingobium chlorophenolicum L-1]|uniref:Cytosolic protein n=1 Tax=Sphingobium chlorophenolicum L-1 TaxID=690566 RepID=F6F366_SPHCR|nr:nuclear transport factor 2 family protein [Sphingobium chlorophenolicum]AEG50878.1 cytosolic protein [Sphingobium chlorophenolicum L-1]
MNEHETRAIVARFFDAVEEGDLDTVAQIYADDIVVWHNSDQIEQTKSQNLAALAAAFERLPSRRYTDRRVNVFDGGFVQQYMFVATRPDGEVIEMPVVVVGKVADGQIKRIDEYFETGGLARLRAPLA